MAALAPHQSFGNTMDLGRGPIDVMSTYNPEELDWAGCDVVLECTGKFNDGPRRRSPASRRQKGPDLCPCNNVDRTVVYGVNHRDMLANER